MCRRRWGGVKKGEDSIEYGEECQQVLSVLYWNYLSKDNILGLLCCKQ